METSVAQTISELPPQIVKGEAEDGLHSDSARRASEHMPRLVAAVQELSFSPDLQSIAVVVKRYAREFTGADGATFILREGDCCYYMDEDAIAPLWKGQRFPMSACVSGWVMIHRVPALIPDIYSDPRIPVDAYRPTFVKSLAIVPIRRQGPLGAIGTYWASEYRPSLEEVTILSALADATAVAIQNSELHQGLAAIREHARQLELTNRELDAFSSSVSHDLRAPLRTVRLYTDLLLAEKSDNLDSEAVDWLQRVSGATVRMGTIIDDLLRLASVSSRPLKWSTVSLSELALAAVRDLGGEDALGKCAIEPDLKGEGDPGLLRILLENLLSNALKYSSKAAEPKIRFGLGRSNDGTHAFFVQDNGVGIGAAGRDRLFQPFQRLHSDAAFQGIGLGLATAKRIIDRHQGRTWIESAPGAGTTVWFSLPGLGR